MTRLRKNQGTGIAFLQIQYADLYKATDDPFLIYAEV